MPMCVQEEGQLLMEIGETAFMTTQRKKTNQSNQKYKGMAPLDVNHNAWWIDSASTIHITNFLKDLRNLRKPEGAKQSVFSGDKMQSHVESIGTCNLVLSSSFILEL